MIRYFYVVSKYKDKNINLPKRSTANSAGYDFQAAEDVKIPSIWKQISNNIINFFKGLEDFSAIKPTLVHTGITAYFPEDEGLFMFNRSSNPFKLGLVLSNGVGLVDSDYSKQEGEIMFGFYNFFPYDVEIKKGDRIGQGVFQKFLTVDSDNAEGDRKGGFGSTGIN